MEWASQVFYIVHIRQVTFSLRRMFRTTKKIYIYNFFVWLNIYNKLQTINKEGKNSSQNK